MLVNFIITFILQLRSDGHVKRQFVVRDAVGTGQVTMNIYRGGTAATRKFSSFLSRVHGMSTTANPRQRFFIYAPDKVDEGTLQKRLEVRSAHVEEAKQKIEDGFIRVGGAVLTPESILTPISEKKMVGSAFIVEAENIDDVKRRVEADVYYKSDVWDKERIVILPFQALTTIP